MAKYKFDLIPKENQQRFLTRLVELRDYLGMSWEGCARVLTKEFGIVLSFPTLTKIYNREITNK